MLGTSSIPIHFRAANNFQLTSYRLIVSSSQFREFVVDGVASPCRNKAMRWVSKNDEQLCSGERLHVDCGESVPKVVVAEI